MAILSIETEITNKLGYDEVEMKLVNTKVKKNQL